MPTRYELTACNDIAVVDLNHDDLHVGLEQCIYDDMAIKITLPDGTRIETDSVREATEITSVLTRRRAPRGRSALRLSNRKSAIEVVLTEDTRSFLKSLLTSSAGMTTDEIVKAAKVEARSVPPIVRNVAKWCRAKHVDVDDILERKPEYVNRKPVTRYSLTPKGKAEFAWIPATFVTNGQKVVTMN